MTDSPQTPLPPIDPTTPAQAPVSDFLGGGEDAFQRKDVFHEAETLPETHEKIVEPDFDVSIPPTVEEDVHTEKITPEPEVEPIPEHVPEFVPEIEPKPTTEPETIIEKVPTAEGEIEKEPDDAKSDVAKKFDELFQMTKKIYEMKQTTEGFDLLGANNDKIHVLYKFFLGDEDYPMVSITKIETDKEFEEETTHELSFYLNEKGTALNVNLDETLLFDEEADFQDDLKKKMQVVDKINKFLFLLSEESRKLEKELKEKEAEEQEIRKLQDVFRNF